MAKKKLKKLDKRQKRIFQILEELTLKHQAIAQEQDRTDLQLKETNLQLKKTDLQLKKTDLQLKKTDLQVKETSREVKETSRELKETSRELRESIKELKESGKEVDRRLNELGKQIGGLGEKFGGFTEGMALPSMEKVLRNQFGMDVVSPRTKVQKDGKFMELDVLAYSNSTVNAVYIVEIKSNLVRKGIDQMMRILEEFQFFFPEHSNKTLYGVLAIVDGHEDLQNEVLEKGIYLAKISDETFTLNIPKDFRPIAYPHTQ